MVQEINPQDCPADLMAELVATATRDEPAGLARLDVLLETYDGDPRLHFLRGSLLASAEAYALARQSMQRAVDIAPGYAVARFQLGLLEMSSGDAAAALETLQPLEALPPDNPLRLFARGLNHLVADDFVQTVQCLKEGIALNTEIPAINHDMQLIVDQALEAMKGQGADAAPVSAAHLLLQQYAGKGPKH